MGDFRQVPDYLLQVSHSIVDEVECDIAREFHGL